MKILVAIDGSDCSMKALEFIAERPWRKEDQFIVLTVAEPIPQEFGLGHVPPPTGEMEDRLFEECAEISGKGAAKLSNTLPDNHVEARVEAGLVADTIIRTAEEWGALLIVCGSHGRKGFKHFLLGSVAEEVLKNATCSVEVVKGKQTVKTEDKKAASEVSLSKAEGLASKT